MTTRAIVFGYQDVGDRCLRALVSCGWDVPLVVTHRANPNEVQWFADVATTARAHEIPTIAPDSAGERSLCRIIAEMKPDFIFSFYYRNLIPTEVLRLARRAALNMHGSLLPRFRGRAPVNWAILKGMRETGVTLHHMVARADAGDIVDQQAVPILGDDDARMVMTKITIAAEIVLVRNLAALAAGTAPRHPQNLSEGEYCGRRAPEDGRIDWRQPASVIHDLVRAVAPPFPGAFTDIRGERLWIHRTRRVPQLVPSTSRTYLYGDQGRCFVACRDNQVLEILQAARANGPLDLPAWSTRLASEPLLLE
jgi:methionyl-tRNA formyltransferase